MIATFQPPLLYVEWRDSDQHNGSASPAGEALTGACPCYVSPKQLLQTFEKSSVVTMGSDPEPHDDIFLTEPKRSPANPDPNRVDRLT